MKYIKKFNESEDMDRSNSKKEAIDKIKSKFAELSDKLTDDFISKVDKGLESPQAQIALGELNDLMNDDSLSDMDKIKKMWDKNKSMLKK